MNAAKEPQQWLTYSGTYEGTRYTPLDQINKDTVKYLHVAWRQSMTPGVPGAPPMPVVPTSSTTSEPVMAKATAGPR